MTHPLHLPRRGLLAAGADSTPAPPPQPHIYEATLGPGGSVVRGDSIAQDRAEELRGRGRDVVVCGPELAANRSLARTIEVNANGAAKRCPPHPNAGPQALPHSQPDPRPPAGHTFYETPHRKAT